MLQSFRCISVAIVSFILVFSAISCRKVERVKGERLELPLNHQWVPITSTQEPWQIRFLGAREGVLYFRCEKSTLSAEDQKQTWSNAEGKIGDVLVFGRTRTYFHYDELNRRSAKTETTTFFRILVLEYSKDGSAVVIVVLPKIEAE